MKRGMKTKLIVLLMAILSLFVFAGCSMGESLDEALATRDLTAQVTYYANGGLFENNAKVKNIYYSTGSKALHIGEVNPTSGSIDISRAGYELAGWYHVDKITDEKNGLCELGDEVDFSTPLAEGEHWTIAAKWRALVGLKVVMVCDAGATIAVDKAIDLKEGVTSFKNGDVIGEIGYDSKDTVTSAATPDVKLFTVKNKTHTFFGYYADAACTKEVSWPIKRGETQQTVYAKYIEGDWTFVKTAREVSQMFAALKGGANKRYWIANDIDCSSLTSVDSITSFGGEIKGNGYTLSNLTFNKSLTAGVNKFAMFGDIQETAKLSDITFTGVKLNATLRPSMHAQIYVVFTSKAAGATVANVNVSATLTVDAPKGENASFVDNINGSGAMTYDNCLFGGYTTDEEYVTVSGGNEFVVDGSAEDFVIFN